MILSEFYNKHRKSIVIASTIISIFGLFFLGYLLIKNNILTSPVNVASWYDGNYGYRKSISVGNSSGSTLTNEDVLVELDTATLISEGKMQTDCDDMRFIDGDDSSSLTYWVEGGCNTSSTQVWVRIPSLPSAGKTIYTYYGNGSASNSSLSWSGYSNIFFEGSCPNGWTTNTDLIGKFLYGSDVYGNTGGSSSHDHGSVSCTSNLLSGSTISLGGTLSLGASSSHTHSLSSTVNINSTVLPPYLDLLVCKNSTFEYPENSIVYFKDSVLTGWTRYSALDDKFPRANSSSGGTGGSSTHTHTTTVGSETTNVSGNVAISGEGIGDGSDGSITISANTNINTTNKISGRSCSQGGDAVSYSITSLSSTSAVVTPTPAVGCLSIGDEILIINLQGNTSSYSNVGNYETLKISNILDSRVVFESTKKNYYGNGVSDDSNIGVGSTNQKVMLQRVPNYSNVTVNAGVNFYPDAWNGVKGGVLFFKANGTVNVNGTIHADGKGYSGGTGGSSDRLIGGYSGESYRGASLGYGGGTTVDATVAGGRAATGLNESPENGYVHGGGGGGGISGDDGTSDGEDARKEAGGSGGGGGYAGGGGGGVGSRGWYNTVGKYGGDGGDVGVSGGGGSGTATNTAVDAGDAGYPGGDCVGKGGSAGNGAISASGGGGGPRSNGGGAGGGGGGLYGIADLTDIHFGSGGGGGGGGATSTATSHQIGYSGANGGGIVFVAANTLTVNGNIRSNGSTAESRESTASGGGGGGGAGGAIKLFGNSLNIGISKVSVTGGYGSYDAGSSTIRTGGAGGVGRIAIYYLTSLSGSTSNTNTTQTYDLNSSYVPYSHTHTVNSATVSSISNLPTYMDMLVGKASGLQYVSSNTILVTNELPPLGWSRYTDLDNKFARGSGTFGATGGSSTHTHTVNMSTGSASSLLTSTLSGSTVTVIDHTHSCTVTTGSVSNVPPYTTVIYAQRDVSEVVTVNSEERPVPTAPTIQNSQALTTTSIRWNFTDNSSDELGFKIYDELDNLKVTCVGSNLTHCDETGLSENTQYTRKVVAYNDAGNSDYSSTTSKYTQVGIPSISYGGSKTINSVDLLGSGQVNGSELYFDCTGIGCDTGLNVWQSLNTDTATGLVHNTGYTFVVKGRNGDSVETSNSTSIEIYTLADTPTISTGTLTSSTIVLNAGNVNNLSTGSSGVIFECTGDDCSTGINEWITTDGDTVTGLQPNTQYTFKVKARNYDGTETSYSSTTSAYTLANAPTLTATAQSDTSISLTAGNVNNLTGGSSGLIFECTGEGCNTGVNEWVTVDSDTVTGLQPNTQYTFRVKARNYDGTETGYSNEVSIYTQSSTPTLTGTVLSDSSVQLTASNISDIDTGNSGLIFECVGENCSTGINEWVTVDNDTVSGLQPNTQYTFRVKARNYNEVETSYSSEVSIYTYAVVPAITGDAIDNTSVSITAGNINNISQGNSGLYFECISENCSTGINEWITIDTDNVTSLLGNTRYTFRVKARNADGVETTFSDTVGIYTHSDIPTISTTVLSNDSVQLTATNINNINIGDGGLYFGCVGDGCSEGISNWITVDNDTVTGLQPNTQYSFLVKAKNYDGVETEFSSSSSIFTHVITPEGLSLSSSTSNSVSLNIVDNSNPSGTEYSILEENGGKYVDISGKSLVDTVSWSSNKENILIENLNPGQEYTFKVKARNGDNVEGEYSETFTTYTKLLTPTTVTPEVISSSSIKWNFTDSNTTEEGFKIYDSNDKLIKTCERENITSCTETGLSSNTEYTRKIKAYNSNTESNFSTTVSARTLSSESSISNITVTDQDTVIINIDANSNDNLQIYENNTSRYFDTSLGVLGSIAKSFDSTDSVTVEGLLPNTAYSFKTRSLNDDQVYTEWSENSEVVTRAQVPSITRLEKGNASDEVRVYINNENNPTSTQFAIQEIYSGRYIDFSTNTLTSTEVWGTFTNFGSTNGILVTGLDGNGQYGFRVKARNSENVQTVFSSTEYIGVVAIIKNAPETLTVSLVEDEDIDLTNEENGQLGDQKVRVKEDTYLLADLPISFETDRDWEDVVLDSIPEKSKTVVKLQEDHGIKGAFTMYVVKGDTNAFRICPEAMTLAEVNSQCPGVVELVGDFPQTVDVEESSVSVSHAILGGVEYWIADGLIGTGAEGFIVNHDDTTDDSEDDEITVLDTVKEKIPFIEQYGAWLVLILFILIAVIILIIFVVKTRKKKDK